MYISKQSHFEKNHYNQVARVYGALRKSSLYLEIAIFTKKFLNPKTIFQITTKKTRMKTFISKEVQKFFFGHWGKT